MISRSLSFLSTLALTIVSFPAIFLFIILHILGPILFIWSANTLFGLGIPFSFKTWLACLTLLLVLRIYLRNSFFFNFPYDYDDDDGEEEEEIEWVPITKPNKRKMKLKAVPPKKK